MFADCPDTRHDAALNTTISTAANARLLWSHARPAKAAKVTNDASPYLSVGSQWQHNPESTASRSALFNVQRPAVRLGDPSRDRESEAHAGATSRGVKPHEAVEDSRPIGLGNTFPLIPDADVYVPAVRRELHS